MIEYSNLEKARQLMAVKSTSDFQVGKGTGGKVNHEDASGCLVYIKNNYTGDDKRLFCDVIAVYLNLEPTSVLRVRLWQEVQTYYPREHGRKKHAMNAVRVALCDVFVREMNDSEKAVMMGVDKSNFAKYHADILADLAGFIHRFLGDGDILAGDYWRMNKNA